MLLKLVIVLAEYVVKLVDLFIDDLLMVCLDLLSPNFDTRILILQLVVCLGDSVHLKVDV